MSLWAEGQIGSHIQLRIGAAGRFGEISKSQLATPWPSFPGGFDFGFSAVGLVPGAAQALAFVRASVAFVKNYVWSKNGATVRSMHPVALSGF